MICTLPLREDGFPAVMTRCVVPCALRIAVRPPWGKSRDSGRTSVALFGVNNHLERQRIGNFCNGEGKLFTTDKRTSAGHTGYPGGSTVRAAASLQPPKTPVPVPLLLASALMLRGLVMMMSFTSAAYTRAGTPSVAGLSTLATGLRSQLRIL